MKLPNRVKILVVGDIIGKGARNAFINYLPILKAKYNYDIISINAENTTHGRGMNYKHYLAYNQLGINVMTMGNHVVDNKEIYNYIDKTTNLIVPANVVYDSNVFENHKECSVNFNGYNIKFINLIGTSTVKEPLVAKNPLMCFDEFYLNDPNSIYIIDYHAEFTLEKNLLAYYVDGKASLVYGTHTHVQTADERILPKKTAYISDVGMVGSVDSVIGYDYQSFVDRVNKQTSTFVSTREPLMLNALYVEIDLDSKEAVFIERINQKL